MNKQIEKIISTTLSVLNIMMKEKKPTIEATSQPVEPTNPTSISITPNNKRKRASFECVICLGDYKSHIPHGTGNCTHQVCRECVRKYFRSTLKDDRYQSYEHIPCPSHECNQNFVTDDSLRRFFSKNETTRWWGSAIKKAYITNKISCPMPRCRGVFEVDEAHLKKCTFTVCYECKRGFCIACQKSWHPGEVRILDDEAELEKTLKKAEQNNWSRCPQCHRLVEKMTGCSTIRCNCGTYFCYRCGGRSDFHYCRNKCQSLTPEGLKAIRSSMFTITKKKPQV